MIREEVCLTNAEPGETRIFFVIKAKDVYGIFVAFASRG
jgi:hypothetical protein